jgi:hypothetical protein
MREIVERDPQEGGDSENLDDVGAACHRNNSNLRDADMSGARSIDPEDMPALFGIIVALCAPYSRPSPAPLTDSGLGLA